MTQEHDAVTAAAAGESAAMVLKESTRGFCSECHRKVDARVVQVGDSVLIEKHCPEHGITRGVLEADVKFYRRHMFRRGLDRPIPIDTYITPVSHRCNIACSFCYFPDEEKAEPTIEQVLEECRPLQGVITLGGAEPTLRRDLPELISRLKENGKTVVLLTNGIRLADAGYVAELKRSGLDRVLLSLSSLRDSFYERMEGHRFLNRKLAALENLAVEGLITNLSATITRGMNDDELGELWQLCLRYAETISTFRVRSSANVGRGMEEIPRLHLSELTDRLADALGVERMLLRDGYDPERVYRSAISFKAMAHLRWSGGIAQLDHVDPSPPWYRTEGESTTTPAISHGRDAIMLSLASWPDVTNVDLEETCSMAHVTETHGVLPFYEAIIRSEDDVAL
jgi:wyosine [tRNA(Phe)-imidazoG37] synthetase (radical SAM superfamily)